MQSLCRMQVATTTRWQAKSLEGEGLFQVHFLFLFRFFLFRGKMNGVAVNVDSFVRPGGTGVFARTAADTIVLLNLGDARILVRNHHDSFCRTVLCARTAVGVFGVDDAIFAHKHHSARLTDFLLIDGKFSQSAAGTDFGADRAFKVAVRRTEIHCRLQQSTQSILKKRRLKDLRRTRTDTDVTGRARLREMTNA
jgi:hypothetical protein